MARQGELRSLDRRILALAVPALGTLAADPLLSLADTAFVSRLGTIPLAALGIDTALRSTGYGVITMTGRKFTAVDCGVIRNARQALLSDCLRRHGSGVEELIKTFKPDVASIEGSFYFKNAKTAMLLGMARGAVVSILARHGLPCYVYAPRTG